MRDIIITTLVLVFGGAVIYTAVLASQIPLGASPTFIIRLQIMDGNIRFVNKQE